MDEKIILARKKLMDPAEQHLRTQKKLWSESTSELISKLISFKRGLNGRGDPLAGLPPSSIREPLPSEIGHYLDNIASHYSALIDGAERIIQEQENYSKLRQKPQSFATREDDLYKEADWPPKWWKINFGLKGDDKEQVKSILKSCISLHDKLLDIENHLTSSDPNSIPKSLYVASSFGIGPYKNIMEEFNVLKEKYGGELKDKEKESTSAESEESLEEDGRMDKLQLLNFLVGIQRDIPFMQSVINFLTSKKENADLVALKNVVNKGNMISIMIGKIKDGTKLSDTEYKDAEIILLAYQKLLGLVSKHIGFDAINFTEYAKHIQNSSELTTEAHNNLSRYLKRLWLENKPDFLRSDIDLDQRKEKTIRHIHNTIISLKKLIDVLFNQKQPDNLLDKQKEIDKIHSSLKEFSGKLSIVIEDIIILAEYHVSMFREENRNKRKGVILHPIIEREINKLRKANVGIREMSDKILIFRPDFVTVAT